MDWLSSKGIAYPDKHYKCDIWKTVDKYKPQWPVYIMDEVASQAGTVSISVHRKILYKNAETITQNDRYSSKTARC